MSGCIERDLAALSPFAIAVDRNVVVFSEATHALLGPSVSISRRLACSIKEARDLSIRHQTRQLADELLRILRLWPTAPAGSIRPQLDLERGVVAARQCRTMLMNAPSLRTTISLSAARKIRLRVAPVADGCDHASSRSPRSRINC
jgi:hypothetical protein